VGGGVPLVEGAAQAVVVVPVGEVEVAGRLQVLTHGHGAASPW